MEKRQLYAAAEDPLFGRPYIDTDQWHQTGVRFRHVHGGFEGTECRFSFFLPDKDQYGGRFFQFLAPVPGDENNALSLTGQRDKIAFSIQNGAYFVESNMGSLSSFNTQADPTIFFRASAAAAEFSRKVAARMYGEHRAFGYLYGGSGGAYKVISCIENTKAWDGAVPYVLGSPMAIPNTITARLHGQRVLRGKIPQIAEALEPGGHGDPCHGLQGEEAAALHEMSRMGFPMRCWRVYTHVDEGSLPIVTRGVKRLDPCYFTDYWTLPGYEGTRKGSTASRDRLCYSTRVVRMHLPRMSVGSDTDGGVRAWRRLLKGTGSDRPWLELETPPDAGAYLDGVVLKVQSGGAKGLVVAVEKIADDKAFLAPIHGQDPVADISRLKPGDRVSLDNCDYIALQTFHRHQVPKEGYPQWDQFRAEDGTPLYPQRPLLGPGYALSGAGSLQSGHIQCKTIVVAAALDEYAYPWQADWYRQRVQAHMGERAEDCFRLWYVDNALHADDPEPVDPLHVVPYLGVLHQALLDLATWVEQGRSPAASTSYRFMDGQLELPETALERQGMQPVVTLSANGTDCASVKTGEAVKLVVSIDTPNGIGKITRVEWNWGDGEAFNRVDSELDEMIEAVIHHQYAQAGVFYPVVRVSLQRSGDTTNIFTQIQNIARAKVIVSG